MCDPAAERHTESSSVRPTDLAIALTINKGLFVELDSTLVAPLAGVVLADLGADLGGELLLLGNSIRLLQLHALQHFGLDVSRLCKDGGNGKYRVKKVLLLHFFFDSTTGRFDRSLCSTLADTKDKRDSED